MNLEPSACEGEKNLKAFERRLTEVIACLHPATLRWRLLLIIIAVINSFGAWFWLTDPKTSVVPLTESLWNHPVFSAATMMLLMLFALGIHKLVISPQIVTSRTRVVLSDFNMSCDDTGKLILKPRPTN